MSSHLQPGSFQVPEESLQSVWDQVRTHLRGALNPATYNLAFGRARALRLTEDCLTLAVDTDFARSWIMQRYRSVLCDALFEVLGADITVEVEVEPDAPDAPLVSVSAPPPPPAPLPTVESRLQHRLTFENFVTGPSNRFAHAAALAVAETPAQTYNPLFIYGGVGLGKTHLLQAIGHFVERNHPAHSVCYVSVETFTNEFINALRDGRIRSFKDRYRSVDLLLIDDIQSLHGREQTQEEFFHTFNSLREAGKQIVISSDRPPKALATLEDRLRSRFEQGLITDIQPPDVETRIAILRNRAQAEGYQIADPDVLPFIASRVDSNVRQLEGALTRVVATGSFHGRPLSVELAREVLHELYPSGEEAITIEMVQREVCRYHGITMDELVGSERSKRVVGPRQLAMYLARELTEASLPALGRAFGGRDHTTVHYAVKKLSSQMAEKGEVFTAVTELTQKLTSPAGSVS